MFSKDVTAAILVSQTNTLGVVLFSYANDFLDAGHVSENTLYYVNYVVLMLTVFVKHNFHKERKRLVSNEGQPQPHIHSKARILSTTHCKMVNSPGFKHANVALASHVGVFRRVVFLPNTFLKTSASEAFLLSFPQIGTVDTYLV